MYQIIAILVLLFRYGQTQNSNCDYYQDVPAGGKYYIYSPNYPNKYPPGTACRWIARCPSGYNLRANCTLNLPQSPTCNTDRFYLSTTGDPQLASADYYCGQGTITAVSTGQQISAGLANLNDSIRGTVSCDLTTQIATSPACSCGKRRMNRIVGGEETGPNEFPMMAAIVDISERTIKCGAVIISKNDLLTAGHCVVGKPTSSMAVVVGEHDITTGTDTPAAKAYNITSYLVHPRYNSSNYDNDIALVRVADITFSDYVGPVCLPFKYVNSDFTGAKVTLLGWGTTSPGSPLSKVLRKVDVDVISQANCQKNVPTLTPRQTCTYTYGKDACQNDSGGPGLYTDPATGILYHWGIISFGRLCATAGSPGVNTKMTSPDILNWVLQNSQDNYCRK